MEGILICKDKITELYTILIDGEIEYEHLSIDEVIEAVKEFAEA